MSTISMGGCCVNYICRCVYVKMLPYEQSEEDIRGCFIGLQMCGGPQVVVQIITDSCHIFRGLKTIVTILVEFANV